MTRTIESGTGYWDVSRYPKGGDFKRTTSNEVVELIGDVVKGEVRVKFADGHNGIVQTRFLREVFA